MARRAVQQSFIGEGLDKPGASFGGSNLTSNPKTKRPLDSRLPIHLVLKAKRSQLRLPKTFAKVQTLIENTSKKHGVRIYRQANVGNHLHFVIKIPSVRRWAAFIRELTGRIAQAIGGLFGKPENGFWLGRPFTRVVAGWQKAYRIAIEYVELNQLEGDGLISRHEIKTLKDLRAIWGDG